MSPREWKTRRLVAQIETYTYLRLRHASVLLKKNQSELVERGIKMLLRELSKTWPQEWLQLPPDLPTDVPVTLTGL